MAMSVDLDRVIHALYEAALDPERWVSAFELLGDALGGCAIGSSVQRSAGWMNFLTYARLDPHYMALMGQQFYDVRTNEMVAVMSGLPAAVAVGRQAVKADGAYFRSSLYNEILAPQGVAHAAVACAFRSPEYFVPLGIFRRTGQEEFGQREHDILKLVLPPIAVWRDAARCHRRHLQDECRRAGDRRGERRLVGSTAKAACRVFR